MEFVIEDDVPLPNRAKDGTVAMLMSLQPGQSVVVEKPNVQSLLQWVSKRMHRRYTQQRIEPSPNGRRRFRVWRVS